MNITIVNLRNTRECIRVDRSTVLGNPFVMHSESERDEVCDKYEQWLECEAKKVGSRVAHAVDALVNQYFRNGHQITLGCWCAPKRCHAESIRKRMMKIITMEISIADEHEEQVRNGTFVPAT